MCIRDSEEVGLDSKWLSFKIDSIANNAIALKATPSMVVQLAKDGKVFYRKSYGSLIPNGGATNLSPSGVEGLYDLSLIHI